MRDTRSTKIKRILREYFPQGTFRVRIKKWSIGESIDIETDLLNGKDNVTVNSIGESIRDALSAFWHVDRDEMTGGILGGGNTYLFVEALPQGRK